MLGAYVLALKAVGSGRWIVKLGKGGDGKGKEWLLTCGVLGEENATTMDVSCFVRREEFRKSAHLAWGKAAVCVQESTSQEALVEDIWKRFRAWLTLLSKQQCLCLAYCVRQCLQERYTFVF